MQFRLKVAIPEVVITSEESINIRIVRNGSEVDTTIRRIARQEVENFSPPVPTICEATVNVKLSKNAELVAEALWNDRLPAGYNVETLPKGTREIYLETGRIEKFEIPKSQLPKSIQDLLDKTHKTLVEAILKVLGLASWKFAQNVPIYAYRYGRMEWSRDGSEWRMTPVNFIVDMESRPPCFWKGNESEIQGIVNDSITEPLSHELFREAWHLQTFNPRSALVIAVVALETGVKDLIAELVPEAEWLIKSLQSPPVFRILDEYLPRLTSGPAAKHHLPSKEIVQKVRNWTDRRNEIVHGKAVQVDPDELKEFLRLVRDLLYLCDYLQHGDAWALNNIRDSTRSGLAAR